jgi:heptosyltransferase III
VITRSPAPPPGVHASDWLADPLASVGLEVAASVPPLWFSPDERDAARPWRERLPERFLAMHPGSGSPRKNWPADRYAALAHDLARGDPFLVVQGPADDAAIAPLRRVPGAVIAHGLPARTLGTLLAEAGVFVGNDSGVTHLAAAAGAHTLALFGPTDPALWAPVGPSVRVMASDPIDALGLPDVAEAAATSWERGPRSR